MVQFGVVGYHEGLAKLDDFHGHIQGDGNQVIVQDNKGDESQES